MFSKSALLGVLGLGAGLAFYLRTPLPDDMDQKNFVRIVGAIKKLTRPLELLAPTLAGHTNVYQFQRSFMQLLTPNKPLDSDPLLKVTNEVFAGVPVRVYRPKGASVPSPVLMHYHGGGWSLGDIDMEDDISRYLAKQTDMVVVSVEYRLAPEHPFPASLDDCVTATVHVLKNGPELGLDPKKVAVNGLSAGGNLAAAVPLRLQAPELRALPRLSCQVLVAPCLQGLDFSLPAYLANDRPPLSRWDMAQFYVSYAGLDLSDDTVQQVLDGLHVLPETRSKLAHYVHRDLLPAAQKPTSTSSPAKASGGAVNKTLSSLAESTLLNPLLSPLLASDSALKAVPPALVVSAPYDVLRDDSLLYAKRLRHAGVAVTSHSIKNGHHASSFIMGSEPGSEAAAAAYRDIISFIKSHNS